MRHRGVAVLVAIAALGACRDRDDGPRTFDDPRGTLRVTAGEEFRVTLPENRSTGYLWRFGRRPSAAVVGFLGSRFELEEGGEDRAGAGGTLTLRFRARAAGRTSMALENVGPSEGRPASVRRLGVAVTG